MKLDNNKDGQISDGDGDGNGGYLKYPRIHLKHHLHRTCQIDSVRVVDHNNGNDNSTLVEAIQKFQFHAELNKPFIISLQDLEQFKQLRAVYAVDHLISNRGAKVVLFS
jgi:hypothetical protein